MYVCLCKAITEDQLKNEANVRRGCPAKDILKRLGVGADCGICTKDAEELIKTKVIEAAHSPSVKK